MLDPRLFSFDEASRQPTVAMALWSRAARSALPLRVLIAGSTISGAVRLGARAFSDLTARSATEGCFVGRDRVVPVASRRAAVHDGSRTDERGV
jgi:hypothetical protein